MEKMIVLVANEPRVYCQVISDALATLRPLVEVACAEPEELDEAVARLEPHLVICSRAAHEEAAVWRSGCLLCWIVLYPDGEDRAEIWTCGGGADGEGAAAGRHLVGAEVGDLLSVVDETELLLCR